MDPARIRILQVNLNHCAGAQDLLYQGMAQWSINLAVIAEPYWVHPGSPVDLDGRATIFGGNAANTSRLAFIASGRGCVAADYDGVAVVAAYLSPSLDQYQFELRLADLDVVLAACRPRPALVLGDFNAWSLAWGSRETNSKGRILEDWANTRGLLVLNRGSVATWERRGLSSIVDISFATPDLAARVQGWHVMEEEETSSDHRYIRFDVSPPSHLPATIRNPPDPRWALHRMNRDALLEASIVQAWVPSPDRPGDVDAEAEWFRSAMSQICDVAMPRAALGPARRQVYWWSPEIARLRAACVTARRRYTRFRRRHRHPDDAASREAELHGDYREARRTLQTAIKRAKNMAREELLECLEHNPWGRPYLGVRGKLRPKAPPMTQSLQPDRLEGVLGSLFPTSAEEHIPLRMASPPAPDADGSENDDVPPVRESELGAVVLRLKNRKSTAPGPDGIPGRAWVLALEELGPRLARLLSACLERGQFPKVWKTGKLVLIRKSGRPVDSPSGFRPIVLLDEVCKLFERIIAERLVEHLTNVGPNLADNQFGFRRGRSTVDAIMRVRSLTEEAVSRGEVVVAVSLDIANAFNTLPWSCIREALVFHEIPPYLRRIIGAYLSERAIVYSSWLGPARREVSCGVPQGSVLGPLLWNIGYDWVLRGALIQGVSVTCYADDTLVTARGTTHRQAALRATAGVAQVVGRIRRLGLKVAFQKSEAICFHGPRNGPPPGSSIQVGGVNIGFEPSMKYLGLVLDSRWNFGPHFRSSVPKLKGTAAALSRLMPNIKGPNAPTRRLYLGIVRSMALYGAPIWAETLTAKNISVLNRPLKMLAVRVIRGYRTISVEAACLLAGTPPWDLEARALASLFQWRKEALERGLSPGPREIETQRSQLQQVLMESWRERLEQPRWGGSTIAAVLPIMGEWLERQHGDLSYRVSQMLTGHGCFGEYLWRIHREVTPQCHHCEAQGDDTALHTLVECTAWASQRRDLVVGLGVDTLSLESLVRAMVSSGRKWNVAASFCEQVMRAKEAAEREREATLPPEFRSLRRERRRLIYAQDFRPP